MARQNSVAEKMYVDGAGEEFRSWRPGTFLRFKFSEGTVIDIHKEDFQNEDGTMSEIWTDASPFHGIAQKFGDAYVRPTKAEDRAEYDANPAAYGLERFKAVLERVTVDQEWVRSAEEAGERTTLLSEAIARAKGIEVKVADEFLSEQRKAKSKEEWSKFRKDLTGIKEVEIALRELKLEREQKALEAAKGKEDTGPTLEGLGL